MPSRTYWEAYLSKAKNGHDRPIDGSATKRVIRGHNGDIVLRLHNTDVVTLHADGTETIRTGGWHTVTTMRCIREWSSASVWSVDGTLRVRVADPEITPPKVWKHRSCKGTGRQAQTCSGPHWCYAGRKGYTFAEMSVADEPCEHGRARGHRLDACAHDQAGRHPLPDVECSECGGTGRYDYGSREIHYAWDGDPLLISADGYAVGPAPYTAPVSVAMPKHGSGGWNGGCDCPGTHTGPPVAAYASPPAAPSYSESGRMLSAALPGLRAQVTCPACTLREPLQTVVIHVNDVHRWTREAIADWLDGLDVDLSFPVPDEIPAHVH